MSWLNPYKHISNLACMLKPHGKMCEAHLRKEHPECFPAQSNLDYVWQMPQKAWRSVFPNGNIFKTLLLLAISVGILYAVIKVVAQRRASIQ